MDTATADIASQRVREILAKGEVGFFASNGFDGASMQDLAQATQMERRKFLPLFPLQGRNHHGAGQVQADRA